MISFSLFKLHVYVHLKFEPNKKIIYILKEGDPANKILFQITNTNAGYLLDSKTFQVSSKDQLGLDDNSVWQVIKSPKETQQSSIVKYLTNFFLNIVSKGYKLCIGDYVKLGRVRFRVKSFKGNNISDNLNSKEHKEEILTQGDGLPGQAQQYNQENAARRLV